MYMLNIKDYELEQYRKVIPTIKLQGVSGDKRKVVDFFRQEMLEPNKNEGVSHIADNKALQSQLHIKREFMTATLR